MYSEKDPILYDKDDVNKRQKKLNLSKILLTIACIFIILLLIMVIILAILLSLKYSKRECILPVSNSTSQGLYMHSAIASDAVPCAAVSNYIMSVKGGNAVDGAIAGLLCTCSVNFHSCGIGGGSFVIIYNKTTKEVHAYDIREMAPGQATENMYANNVSSIKGGKSIAVMGLVSGYYEIHKRFGKLEWKVLFEPSIDILTNGFYVSKSIEDAIDYFFSTATPSEFAELRKVLTDSTTGKPKRFGDIIKIPKLANTMRILSNDPYAMKNGSLVDTMIAEISTEGGIISKDDFLKYEMKERKPISVNLGNDNTLYTLPPPSSGVLVAFSLNVLSNYHFDINFLDSCKNTELFFHRLVETMKFSFGKRSALGDMDFVNVSALVKNLTSDSYAEWIKSLITDDKTHPISYYHPSFDLRQDHGTSHFSLVSPEGDAVSITSTINYLFGSLIMGNETGIIYNDEMDDFSSPNQTNIYNLPPSPSNFIKPYKRPMSSMSPFIMVDRNGQVVLVLGASGGSKILSSTTQVAVLARLFNKTMKEAIDIPRVHHQLLPDVITVEMNFPDNIIKSLEERGHKVVKNPDKAVCQGIRKSESAPFWQCYADHRKMGLCDGS